MTLFGLAACTGEVLDNPGQHEADGGAAAYSDADTPGTTPPTKKPSGTGLYPDQGTWDGGPVTTPSSDQAVKKDTGTPATKKDASTPPPLKKDGGFSWPDYTSPDMTLTTKAGGPCPCAAGLLCFGNTCRATCKKPADACGVTSNCAKGFACVTVTYSGVKKYVCLPGVGLGKPCAKAFCADNRICGSVNGKAHICLSTCTKAFTACGTGGMCLKSTTTSCHFCTKP